MANGGWYGTKEEWDRIEAPLLEIDQYLERFAVENNLSLSKNLKGGPNRSFEWGISIRNLIQIFLVSETELTFNLWVCASEDRGNKRYWKKKLLFENQTISNVKMEIPDLLDQAYSLIKEWNERPNEFEFATKLAKLPT